MSICPVSTVSGIVAVMVSSGGADQPLTH